jgi:ribonucleotide monophosphatase NagD (HAD superfamily)
VITQRFGLSRVLVIGAPEMAAVVAAAGHQVVDVGHQREATVLALGNDFELTYERLAVACRVAARTGALVTPNVDPRLPVEDGDFLPGCGALVAAVAAAAGVAPIVVGKPEPPLFGIALERLRVAADRAVMVGDSVPSDMRGARRVGMRAALFAPAGAAETSEADVVIRSFGELARLAGV